MLERVAAVVGAEGVRAGEAVRRWAVHGVVPRVVAAPATAEAAAELFALASREGWAVEPAGAGGWLHAGRVPERIDLVVTTERMASLVEHEPPDLVATIEAGMPLQTLNERLAPHRQWLPLDPPAFEGATVGAAVSLAAAGPLRERHGTPRDHVLGLRVVTGDGRILDLGGKVVKNAAGYDLVKLMIGARGTLGLVTRLHLRLRPIPERDATLVLSAAGPAPLVEVVGRMGEERIGAAALELVTARAGAGLAAPLRGEGEAAGWKLFVRLQGNAESVADASDRVRRLASSSAAEIRELEDAADVWAALGTAEAAAESSIRLADARSRLGQTLEAALRLPGAGSSSWIAAHAGAGIVRVNASAVAGGRLDSSTWAAALRDVRVELAERGGTAVVANGPAALLDGIDPFGEVGPALRLMRALKVQFDPAGVLAPGRFVV